jgi:branched-chain amino acid transport system ATP-binding protein
VTRGGLEVDNLRAERAGRLVVAASFAVAPGELAVLVSAPGGGASTLAAAIAGAIPSAGTVRVAGRVCRGEPARRRRRGGLAACLPDLDAPRGCTVEEAIRLAARDRHAAAWILERVPLLIERRGLEAGLLSGGETQLLRIACALAGAPAAIVLDEPTAGLADDVAATVRALARQEAGRGASVLWLDGDPDAADLPAPARLRLVGGEVVELRGSAEPGTGCSTDSG